MKRLLKTTLLSMEKALLFDELPKTFQDAIILTRHLGIQYLWIDSLCIIQDSHEDWATESEQMEFVYKSAVCNIAATAASNSQEGCFVHRDPELARACRVKIINFVGEADDDIATETFDICSHDAEAKNPMLRAPLNRRAWVTQEQYLSNRIIHCARSQLYWECREVVSNLISYFADRVCPKGRFKVLCFIKGCCLTIFSMHLNVTLSVFHNQQTAMILQTWNGTLRILILNPQTVPKIKLTSEIETVWRNGIQLFTIIQAVY